ncbi:MAG: lipopolysaccharide biosynthesis protein [Tepidiformaceae bacterium]
MTGVPSSQPPRDDAPPRGSVGRRVAAALATIALGQGLTAVAQLAGVTLLLVAWGARLYGEWLILFAIPAYLSVSDLGFASVAGNEMTMLAARGERERACELFRAVSNLLLVGSVALIVVGLPLLWFLPVRRMFGLRELSEGETTTLLILLICQVVVTIQSGVLDAGFRAGGRFPLGALCRQSVRVAEVSAVPLAATLGAPPVGAAAALLAVTIAGNGLSWLVLRRTVTWLRFRLGRPQWKVVRPIARPALAYSALPLGNALSLQGMVLVVGAAAGPLAVVVFHTARTLSRLPQGLMYAINQSVWPEVTNAVAAGNLRLARTIHRRACQGSLLLTALVVALLLPLGTTIIDLWTGGKVDVSFTLFGLLLLVIGLNSLWFTSSVVLVATNSHQAMALLYLGGSVLALSLAAVFVPLAGLVGAAWSLAAIDGIMVGFVLPRSLRLVRDSPAAFLSSIFRIPRMALR